LGGAAGDGWIGVKAAVVEEGVTAPLDPATAWETLMASVGGSTCCEVELKYRARLGRRKVGGSAAGGAGASCTALRSALLNIVTVCGLALCNCKSWSSSRSTHRESQNLAD
jgi:hypothetical protein